MINDLQITTRLKVILGLIILALLSRVLPHEPNFVPLAAIALFAGTYIQNRQWAVLLPISLLLISDLFLEIFSGNGFHSTMVFVYCSLGLIASIGFWLRDRVKGQTIVIASLTGSLLFYIITNLGVWLVDGMYPMSSSGLFECYVAAIPFFRGTLMGDLFYNLLLFGAFAAIRWRFPAMIGAKR